ncbi:cytochrome c oxidase subunit 5B, mitochondrial-like [Galleria mellonella]|uniref:Cytochrome c oxidase subunit 5B, mitochondrial-like n=1 Tax=Galleria mellonella TaxID=7137 RepID=A0A6J1X578_GALME|nr:cytochrome c oxidase subunit 5B, mitochondrial-like [Galleria mellonella]
MWWTRTATQLRRFNVRSYGALHDPLDHVTGIQKRELLAHLAGECDPFRIMAIKRGPGTCERPNLIPSAYASRLMGCICHPDQNHAEYMWLHQGVPKRCGCGYWFELCPVAPL